MPNIPAVNALITAINFDRFSEIEAHHSPDAVFHSFRGPTLRGSVAIADWHREFLRDYADCNYTELEYIEQGDTVAVRATIEAKAYDWRAFTQRILETFTFDESGEVSQRRMYGMMRDIELDKLAVASITDATGYKGGSPSATKTLMDSIVTAGMAGDADAVKQLLNEKLTLIDGVYGVTSGADNALALMHARPGPAFGQERCIGVLAGEHTAVMEFAIDPNRPRFAEWVRIVDDKVRVVEAYWMLREIGVNPYENYANDRHRRQVIMPI